MLRRVSELGEQLEQVGQIGHASANRERLEQSLLSVVSDQRRRLLVVHLKSIHDNRFGIVGALNQLAAALPAQLNISTANFRNLNSGNEEISAVPCHTCHPPWAARAAC